MAFSAAAAISDFNVHVWQCLPELPRRIPVVGCIKYPSIRQNPAAIHEDEREEPFLRIDPYVVPEHSLTGDNTERVDVRALQVIYRFDPPPFPVYVGQQVDVFIASTS